MKPAILCGFVVSATLYLLLRNEPIVTQPETVAPKPAEIQQAKQSDPTCGDGPHCNHDIVQVTQQVHEFSLDREPTFWTAKVGTWVLLEFALGGMKRGKVTYQDTLPSGTVKLAMTLPSGHDLFLTRSGRIWEGRALSPKGEAGWRIEGNGRSVCITQLPHSSLICARDAGSDELQAEGLPPYEGPVEESGAGQLEEAESMPIFNSRPGANGTIYLDFDGETVTGTQWNSSKTGGAPIVAGSPNFSVAQIEEVWKGVSEDFRSFNVNVTTDRAVFDATALGRRTMVIFTPSNEWYGSAGGVAYVDVFGSTLDYPAWVFTDQIANSPANAAEAASHETGHTLGLRHDGTSSASYYSGHGSGAVSWAPIMGNSYGKSVTHWSKGEYPGANNVEDDLALISNTRNGIGFIADDHSGSVSSATLMTDLGSGSLKGDGIIERGGDADVFRFLCSSGPVSFVANNGVYDPNLDIRLELLDASGSVLVSAAPSGNLDATISTTVSGGTFHLRVSATGNGDLVTGYSDYGSLGGYAITGTVPSGVVLAAQITSPSASAVSLREGNGLLLKGLVAGGNPSWQLVSGPLGQSVTFSSPESENTEVRFPVAGTYQLKFFAISAGDSVEDTLTVHVDSAGSYSTTVRAPAIDLGENRTVAGDRINLLADVSDEDSAGLSYRWSLISGNAQLSSTTTVSPDLVFSESGQLTTVKLSVSDGQNESFAYVELTPYFSYETLITQSDTVLVNVPSDPSLSNSWIARTYDDSAWQSGSSGVGFDNATPDYYSSLIGVDVETLMYKKQTSCFLRVPFVIEDPQQVLSMTLQMKYEDGFVAYLNGVEIARANAPGGTPMWNSIAATNRNDDYAYSFEAFPVQIVPGLLVSGTNVLAIHGLNSGKTTSERRFLLVPELDAMVGIVPPVDPGNSYDDLVSLIPNSSLREPGDDADGDGRCNLYEYGSGSSILEADQGYPMVRIDSTSQVSVLLPADPPEDVRYAIQHCPDLKSSWSTLAARTGSGAWSPVIPLQALTEGADHTRYFFPVSGTNCGFFRLSMELVPP